MGQALSKAKIAISLGATMAFGAIAGSFVTSHIIRDEIFQEGARAGSICTMRANREFMLERRDSFEAYQEASYVLNSNFSRCAANPEATRATFPETPSSSAVSGMMIDYISRTNKAQSLCQAFPRLLPGCNF